MQNTPAHPPPATNNPTAAARPSIVTRAKAAGDGIRASTARATADGSAGPLSAW
jgi:hypothetical protein